MDKQTPFSRSPVLIAALIGLLATAVCFAWLSLEVHFLYQGHWSGTFYVGALRQTPPELDHEHFYRFPAVLGYDGDFYHLIAHDPLFKKGFDKFVETPRIRYRRILLPALAGLLSFGHDNWIDPAIIFVVLAAIFLGTFWSARWCSLIGLAPAWGLLFLAIPANLTSILFMIADGLLATLTVGFFWYVRRQNDVGTFVVLACAALTRELGVGLIAGYCFWLLVQHKFVRAVVFATALVPAALWFWFVQQHTAGGHAQFLSWIPFLGIYRGIVGHWHYAQPFLVVLDYVALAGMLLAFAFAAFYLFRRKTWNEGTFIGAGFLLLGIFLSHPEVWPEVNAYARYFTPLLLFVVTTGIVWKNWWTLLPIALLDLRIGSVFLFHAIAIGRAMLGRSS